MASYLYNIQSGSIVENVTYQVYGVSGDVVTYDGTDYTPGDFFTGVEGVTDYAVTGSPTVTEASELTADTIGIHDVYTGKFTDDSYYKGAAIGVKEDFFLGKFTDESWMKGIVIGIKEDVINYDKVSNIRAFPRALQGRQLQTELNI